MGWKGLRKRGRPGLIEHPGLLESAELDLVDVVQRARLQTQKLLKMNPKESQETHEWQFFRPFLGHGDRRFPETLRKPGLSNCEVLRVADGVVVEYGGRRNTQ